MSKYRSPRVLALVVALMLAGPAFHLSYRSALAGVPENAPAANRLEVNLSERRLYVYSDGQLMNSFPVGIGEQGHETPTGDFTIDRIIWNPDWVPPNAEWAEDKTRKAPGDPDNPMRGAKLFFEYPDYYIHGTDEPASVGEPASKGCLRMNVVDVNNLAEWVQKIGGESRSEEWFRQVKASDTDMREVTLSDPVPISIYW